MSAVTSASPPAVQLAAVKTRQQAAWSAGNYAVVGTTLQIVGENLCEALDLRAGSRVLDVAAGNGNASLDRRAALVRRHLDRPRVVSARRRPRPRHTRRMPFFAAHSAIGCVSGPVRGPRGGRAPAAYRPGTLERADRLRPRHDRGRDRPARNARLARAFGLARGPARPARAHYAGGPQGARACAAGGQVGTAVVAGIARCRRAPTLRAPLPENPRASPRLAWTSAFRPTARGAPVLIL